MPRLLRLPLTWMVLAEFVVVAALIVVAWNVVGAAARSAAAAPPQPGSAASPAPDPALDTPGALPTYSPPAAGPLPGLNLSSAFWRQRLDQLNQDQVFFEQLEWRIVHSAVDAMQRYIETVVVPAVRQAEKH